MSHPDRLTLRPFGARDSCDGPREDVWGQPAPTAALQSGPRAESGAHGSELPSIPLCPRWPGFPCMSPFLSPKPGLKAHVPAHGQVRT